MWYKCQPQKWNVGHFHVCIILILYTNNRCLLTHELFVLYLSCIDVTCALNGQLFKILCCLLCMVTNSLLTRQHLFFTSSYLLLLFLHYIHLLSILLTFSSLLSACLYIFRLIYCYFYPNTAGEARGESLCSFAALFSSRIVFL